MTQNYITYSDDWLLAVGDHGGQGLVIGSIVIGVSDWFLDVVEVRDLSFRSHGDEE